MKKLIVMVALACLLGACQMVEDALSGPAPDAVEHLVLTTEIQVGALRMQRAASELVVGNIFAHEELSEQRAGVNRAMGRLRSGDAVSGLSPLPDYMHRHLAGLEEIWRDVDHSAESLLERVELVIDVTERSADFVSLIPQLQARADGLARELLEGEASLRQVYVASRQLVLADRMLRRIGDMMAGGNGAITAADWLSREATLFGSVLNALTLGDEQMGVTAVEGEGARAALLEVTSLYEEINGEVAVLLEGFSEMQNLQSVADSLFLDSEYLAQQAGELARDYATLAARR
jgi:twitching motility protein PilJ